MKRLLLLIGLAACARGMNAPRPIPLLPQTTPTLVGMSANVVSTVDSIMAAAIANRAAPGGAVAIGRHGKLVVLKGYGSLDYRPGFAAVTDSSIYDLASLSKVIGTTSAAMMLVDAGRLDLDAPLVRYLPELKQYPDKQQITVRNALQHNAGFRAFAPLYLSKKGESEYLKAIGELPLDYPTGTKSIYSDFGPMLVGMVMERITGQTLDKFLRNRLFEPLGMHDTYYNPPASELARIAPTEIDTSFRHAHIHGVVHDENAFALGGVAGHAGLFSSARDLAKFAQMMLNRGEYGGRRFISAETIALFTRKQSDLSSRGLGWDTPSPGSSAGDYFSPSSFGHTGFTGTSIWIDPEQDLFVILLTNRVNPTRDTNKYVALRITIANAVQQSLTERAPSRVR